MRQDFFTGQPLAGAIGGLTDLGAVVATVDRNFNTAYRADVAEGFTSPEQGRNYAADAICKTETESPDRPLATLPKAIPFLVIAGLVAAIVFLSGGRHA